MRRGTFSLAAVFLALSGYTGTHSKPVYSLIDPKSCCVDPTLLAKPIGNSRLFFGQCPKDKSPETLCSEASSVYGAVHTSMYPVPVKSSYSSRHASDKSHHYFTVEQEAAVALVGNGCCFNVFPNVMKEDKLLNICQNPVIGRDTLSILEFYSVYVAGDFFPQIPSELVDDKTNIQVTQLSVVTGGSYRSDASVLETEINTLGALGGNFPNNPLVVGGNVGPSGTDPPAPILWFPVSQGVAAAIGGDDVEGRVMDPTVRIRDPDEVSEQISTQICALSQDLHALPVNGNVEFATEDDDQINLTIACASGETCVVDIEFPPGAAQPDTVINVGFSTAASVSSVIINVKGRMVVFAANFMNDPGVPVVWNFYEATDVDIASGNVWYGSIIVPRAGMVKLRLGAVNEGIKKRRLAEKATSGPTIPPKGDDDDELIIVGTLVVGGVDSHTSVFFTEILPSFPRSLPKPQPTVTMCECLCPDEEVGYA